MSKFISIYEANNGMPLYWKREASGVLRTAVTAYLKRDENNEQPTPEQLEVLIDRLIHYIWAPCWRLTLASQALRTEVFNLKTADDIDRWLEKCLDA